MRPLKQKQLDSLLGQLQEEDQYVFLDTARSDKENSHSFLFLQPHSRLEFFQGDDPAIFIAAMEEVLASGHYLAGWLSYEFGYLLEPQVSRLLPPQVQGGSPLASFGVFSEPFRFNHGDGKTNFPALDSATKLAEFSMENITLSQEKESYLDAIQQIKAYIAAGDTYQVNYTLRLLFDFQGSAEAFYRTLRRNQSVAYGAIMHLGAEHILSLSPELFFKAESNTIVVRPMKGTMQRGRDWKEDQDLSERLKGDPKNRSENVMIVDLLRNDLARLIHQIGEGKVLTQSLFDVECYESVLQMTSSIYAETDGGIFNRAGIFEILKALFPCGSVTGAPKIRTMEIIRELEESPRGVYTGAIGYFSPEGSATFNVPIRTIRLTDGKGEMGIGSGIVYDSDPEQEWQECLLKADFLTRSIPVFVLIETLLFTPEKGCWLVKEHLERLHQSANYFSFSFSEDEILLALQEFESQRELPDSCYRVRLTLAKDGTVETTSQPCDRPQKFSLPKTPTTGHEGLPAISLSSKKVDSSSPWFFHKTSNRGLFQEEFARAGEQSLFDIVFLNERQELTEGCISNIIVFLDGNYFTPPVSSGLLAGTMRRKLLSDDSINLQEKVLNDEDLHRADALFCCNSVRGVVQVHLTE